MNYIDNGGEQSGIPNLYSPVRDSEIIDLWVAGKAAKTQTAYRAISAEFLRSVQTPLRECSIAQVQRYTQYLIDKNQSINSISTKIAAIKSLSRFGATIGECNDFALGAKLKAPHSEFESRSISPAEVAALFAACRDVHETAMVSALYGLALRANEACKLRWSDFSVRGDGRLQLRVVGKGGRTATILVPAWVWDCFMALPREGDRIFYLTENSLWIWFKRLGVRAGINPAASPHWMRHSNAVHSIENGCPIDVIRETLRHANISTTSHYLRAQNRQSSGDFLGMG